MNLDGFKTFLQGRKLDAEKIKASVNLIRQFSRFLKTQKKTLENASYEDLYNFFDYLIENKINTFENFASLFRFGHFQQSNELANVGCSIKVNKICGHYSCSMNVPRFLKGCQIT